MITWLKKRIKYRLITFNVPKRRTSCNSETVYAFAFRFSVSCPAGKGWVYFSGSLYQVSSTKKTWDQSRSDCRQKGADLLIINSEEEQAFANRFQKYMWIGLTDVTNEGSWKWVDGTAMSTRLLSLIRGLTLENCVDIKNFNAEKSWNDESCSLSLLWICEKKLFQ
uniref:C-type lectin domain-containing protein n=1 Tax=Takifugu rubripes TaxID=31033 RepID=A0A674NFD6_TAKRU